jgi:alpha-ketoglutarate-dependent taurine dioxygenase
VPAGDARSGELLRQIRPQPANRAKPNTLSSRFGMDAFPFHTDTAYWPTPARFILFYCKNPGSGDRPTVLIDPRGWSLSEATKRLLCNEVWRVRTRRPFHCTIGSEGKDGLSVRFDEACMVPVTSGAQRALEFMRDTIIESCEFSIQWREGDLLVLDNQRLLHARGRTLRPDEDRVLARILIRE